jgi:hypothetical protein
MEVTMNVYVVTAIFDDGFTSIGVYGDRDEALALIASNGFVVSDDMKDGKHKRFAWVDPHPCIFQSFQLLDAVELVGKRLTGVMQAGGSVDFSFWTDPPAREGYEHG